MAIQWNAQNQGSFFLQYSRMKLVNCGSGETGRVLPQTLDVTRFPRYRYPFFHVTLNFTLKTVMGVES